MLTQEVLKIMLSYDPETGIFTRLKAGRRVDLVGKRAGWSDKDGYIRLKIGRKTYLASRLAWFYMTGEWPKNEIDHRDLNKSNNAWSNLREATRSQNIANIGKRSDNASGHKGVYWWTVRNCWRAQLQSRRKTLFSKNFATKEEASAAYAAAARQHFGEFARTE